MIGGNDPLERYYYSAGSNLGFFGRARVRTVAAQLIASALAELIAASARRERDRAAELTRQRLTNFCPSSCAFLSPITVYVFIVATAGALEEFRRPGRSKKFIGGRIESRRNQFIKLYPLRLAPQLFRALVIGWSVNKARGKVSRPLGSSSIAAESESLLLFLLR